MKDEQKNKVELIEELQKIRSQMDALKSALPHEEPRAQMADRLRAIQALSSELSAALRLDDTLRMCVDAALQYTSLDCGGIYLIDEISGEAHLIYSKGLSPEFVASIAHYGADEPSVRLIMEGRILYVDYSNLPVPMDKIRNGEGLRSIVIIPIQHKGKSIACINLGSHTLNSVSDADQAMLETIGTLVGGFVVRAQEEERHKQAEEEKAQLEGQLQQAHKMEAIGRLAGGVAHDFNNILCAITGNATMILHNLPTIDPLRQPIEQITKAANRATDLTRQLLAFSRKQVVNLKVIDLSDLVNNLHSMLSRLINEDIILRTMPQKKLGGVRADPGQIEQIVLNLVVNARDAMPNGGELLIETADVNLEEDYCDKHAGAVPGAYVMLAVSDTGCGMSLEVRKKIFEPFFSTKALGQGTGLGLATVFGIVEQNAGRIEVYSEPGQGSSFKVYLPRVADKGEFLKRPEIHKPVGGKETLLLVEDEEMVLDVALQMLEQLGYHVLSANSGKEAIATAERHDGPIDLLLTDVVMPHMNGRELAEKFAELQPGIKVLYSSGYTQNAIVHHGVLDEDLEFIAKPYSLNALAVRLREVLDQE